MKLLYVAFSDLEKSDSGSSVRPAMMREAFLDIGVQIIEYTGEQTEHGRRKKLKEIEKQIEKERPDFCYIESPVHPILHYYDRMLIRKIHFLKIPIGYFYRDMYRRFPDIFPRRTGFMNSIKEFILDVLQTLTDITLKKCDIIYFASKEAASQFSYKLSYVLPPAGRDFIPECYPNSKTSIYVGGLVGPYRGDFLLEVFATLNNMKHEEYKLILVCRENEWNKLESPYKNEAWLEVYHVSGDELKELYRRASIAIGVSDQSNYYNDMAISVKTFEYMSYGLPQIVANTKAMSRLMEETGAGIAIDQTIENYVSCISYLLNNPEELLRYRNQVKASLLNDNLWKHRAKKVVDDLCKI